MSVYYNEEKKEYYTSNVKTCIVGMRIGKDYMSVTEHGELKCEEALTIVTDEEMYTFITEMARRKGLV